MSTLLTSSGYIKAHSGLNDNTYDKMIVPALTRAQDLDVWRCSLDRWEFDVWSGSCSEFENKKPLCEDKYGK